MGGEFFAAWPGAMGAVDDGGDYGGLGAFQDQCDAGLDGAELAAARAGAFGEHGEDLALVHAAEGFFYGGYIGFAAADGKGVEHANEPGEAGFFEELGFGDE